MPVVAFDHVALATSRPERMLRFYCDLGFEALEPQEWRSNMKS
jgi:catechol 2,3-dioxygenase-like lactoylglutathione lyase family enzyme